MRTRDRRGRGRPGGAPSRDCAQRHGARRARRPHAASGADHQTQGEPDGHALTRAERAPPGPDEPPGLARITAIASTVHGGVREVLLVHGTLEPHGDDAWDVLHDAIRVAVAAGHHVDAVAAAVAPHAGRMAAHRAAGLLRADAVVLAEVEDHLVGVSEELGGEVPVGDSARMRGLVARARRDLDASVRRAVASGLTCSEILEIAAHAGLALEPTDLVVAFESAR